MRDIKFKGKRLDGFEWIYGNIVYSEDSTENYRAIIIPLNESNMFTDGCDLGFECWYNVNPKTIGQHTGLNDKNGIEVYEGDIFKQGKLTFEVIFIDGGFCAKQINCNYYDFLIKFMPLEICGNIHENPELLEVE